MTILFVVKTEENALVNAADTSVIFVFLLLYAVSCICFSFMISTFFKKGALSSEIFISSKIVYHNAYAWQLGDYRQVSNIRRAKFQHLRDSRTVLRLSLPNPLKPDVKSIMKM